MKLYPIANTHRGTRRAFTLVEVIVVMAILVMILSITIPRLTGGMKREFDLAVDRVSDLLLFFAQRDTVGRAPIGLMLDRRRDDNRLRFIMVRMADDGTSRGPVDWVSDIGGRHVDLPAFIEPSGFEVFVDGDPVDLLYQPLVHTPGHDRPTIEITLTSADRSQSATLRLTPYGLSAQRLDGNGPERRAINLDAAGRSRDTW
jgi:prepilin-type N-terminal cleavage/methylation domain-containing protein